MTSALKLADLLEKRAAPAKAEAPDTRSCIVSIAERIFREIGYRKTTVADIAKALRMSPANVYRFFESKKEINEAVADRLLAEVETELLRVATAPGRTAPARLRTLIETYSRMSVERFTANRRMHEMVEVAMSESWEVVHRHLVGVDALLCQLVAEGVAAGEFRALDPQVAARCVHAAIVRFCHPGLIVQCADEPGPSLDDMCDFILASLRPA